MNIAPLTPIEARWLTYTVELLNDSKHRNLCEQNKGAQGTPALDRSLRWPGYVGSAYAKSVHRILCVGQVHHASELYRTLEHLEPTLRNITTLQQPYGTQGEQLIRKLQDGYEKAITSWGPWKKFIKIIRNRAVGLKYGD